MTCILSQVTQMPKPNKGTLCVTPSLIETLTSSRIDMTSPKVFLISIVKRPRPTLASGRHTKMVFKSQLMGLSMAFL